MNSFRSKSKEDSSEYKNGYVQPSGLTWFINDWYKKTELSRTLLSCIEILIAYYLKILSLKVTHILSFQLIISCSDDKLLQEGPNGRSTDCALYPVKNQYSASSILLNKYVGWMGWGLYHIKYTT